MAKLAADYIYCSNGKIAAILGLDIAYRVGSKKASIFIWRSEIIPDPAMPSLMLKVNSDLCKETFRDDDGAASLGLGLSLQLHDFAPKIGFADTAQETQLSTVVQIPCGQLCSFCALRRSEIS